MSVVYTVAVLFWVISPLWLSATIEVFGIEISKYWRIAFLILAPLTVPIGIVAALIAIFIMSIKETIE